MRVNIEKIVLMLLFVAAMTSVGFGQRTTATFAGIVTDPTGAVLPGAEIEMINDGTAALTRQLTGETGEFVFNFVPAGTYTLKIVMPGFKTYESRAIPLGAAQNVRRTYVLEVGNISENVTVTGEAPLVNTLSTEQRLSLETLEIKNLPMVNRNITNILTVGSGLTRGDPDGNGAGASRLRLNGLGSASMSVMADGTDANANAGSAAISQFGGPNKIDQMSTESIAEVQVIKGVMPAEYGSAMAGTLSLITKSGTNDWHGSLFHRYEGSVLSARQAFLTSEPNSVWNQFGGSLGGRIKRDRLFFFFAYEGYRQRTSAAISPTVPTPYFRDIILKSMPFPQTQLFLDFHPLPNQPYGPTDLLARWVGPGLKKNNDDHMDGRIDYLVGGGNFSLSSSGGHPYQSAAQTQPLSPQIFTTRVRRVSMNYVIGRGRWTSSSRAGYNYNYYVRQDKLWDVKDPTRTETTPGYGRVPVILFTGMTSYRVERSSRGLIPSYSFEQQIALVQGTHSWKFGGILALPAGGKDEVRNQDLSYQTLADIQRNEPSSVQFSAATNPSRWRMLNFGAFIQDDWRINRRFVVNLGLRYDRYDHVVVTPLEGDRPAQVPNLDGLRNAETYEWGPLRDPNNPYEADKLSLAPRFGFAYTMDNSGGFVVRGGFGVNFQSVDPQHVEQAIAKGPYLPNDFSYTRAEAAARGLKYPLSKDDLEKFVASEFKDQPQVGYRTNPNQRPPYAMNYTLGIQRALTSRVVLETAYVGTRGVKFQLIRTYNRPDRLTGLRPNRNDISSQYRDDSQQTNYNSWQTSLKQRLTHGLLLNIHHTWSKTMAYTGGDIGRGGDFIGGIEDFNDVKIERTLAYGDATHSVVVDWVYQIPALFANAAIARQIFGGWQISGIWNGRTGIPIPITQSGGRPDIIDIRGAVNRNCCSFGNLQYLDSAAFKLVAVNSASGRTIRRGYAAGAPLRGPGFTNLNLSLGKSFSLAERKDLELKADMLNALNQTQYTTIATNLSGVNFGQAIGTATARVIQLQLRLSF